MDIDNIIAQLWASGASMTSPDRLQAMKNIYLKYQNNTESFVECGVAKGGHLALMKLLAFDKQVWGFDSFDGMPPLTVEDKETGTKFIGYKCCGEKGVDAVYETFANNKISTDKLFLIKGWFEDTLFKHKEQIGKISVLRIDSDWYKSTLFCLNTLYEQIIEGGIIIIDDYGVFPGCNQAVNEYRQFNKITSPICYLPQNTEIYWVK